MKISVSKDTELVKKIRKALKNNDGYCPCILNSKNKGDIKDKCMCYEFIHNTESGCCHCGLYFKEKGE